MMQAEIRRLQSMAEDELFDAAKDCVYRMIWYSMFTTTASCR